jgi:hypothetical protein
MKSSIAFLFCFCSFWAFSQEIKIEIQKTEIVTIESKEVSGQKFDLQIIYPSSYLNSDKTYPVIILIDGQKEATLLSNIYRQLHYDGLIPECIIVGVTWSEAKVDYDALRRRDFTFAKQENIGGGADKFMNFLNYEMMPLLQDKHKADIHNKTIIGGYLGGLFVVYTLFTQPQSFTNYIAASPALNWANNGIENFEELYFMLDAKTNKRLYMTYGNSEEGIKSFTRMVDTLKSKKYPDIKFNFEIIKDTSLTAIKTLTYLNGLKYAFERKNIRIHESIMKSYAGKYYASDKSFVELIYKDDKLHLMENENSFKLNAESETSFYSPEKYLKLLYFSNISGFKLEKLGNTKFYKK